MRTIILIFSAILISGCHSMYGNVVPKTGPTMEQVYDGMNKSSQVYDASNSSYRVEKGQNTIANSSDHNFQKIPNPELTLYVFPHLAGESEIPIPGYTTVFTAYEKNHYALPQDTVKK